jgi:hypothetical protein
LVTKGSFSIVDGNSVRVLQRANVEALVCNQLGKEYKQFRNTRTGYHGKRRQIEWHPDIGIADECTYSVFGPVNGRALDMQYGCLPYVVK